MKRENILLAGKCVESKGKKYRAQRMEKGRQIEKTNRARKKMRRGAIGSVHDTSSCKKKSTLSIPGWGVK